MDIRNLVAVGLLAAVAASCGGMAGVAPTAPSPALASLAAAPDAQPPSVPAPSAPDTIVSSQSVRGAVQPVGATSPPCWADRYPCEVYDFTLTREGTIEVTLTWDGHPRALMVQLYWAGEGLAHEDIAPREGPSRIYFRRSLMEAHDYRLRVVSLEPGTTIPFTLTVTY
jgi:hypothetical protein